MDTRSVNELYHYGVKGMKWGVRRDRAKAEYKSAKKDLRDAYRIKTGLGVGVKGIQRVKAKQKKIASAQANVVSKKAAYNAAKKKNQKSAERAEFNTYRREMLKSGLAGSLRDEQSGGRSTAIYNQIKVQRGQEYADRVQKSVQNRAYAQIAGGVAVGVGMSVASAYLNSRYR